MLRVLLVDDHADSRRAIRQLLRARGFEVVAEAYCAETAVAVATALAPDAALLDVHLGADDGYDVCSALVAALPHIAVVLTSSDEASHAARLVRSAGALGFVAKARLHNADLHALFTRAA